MRSRKYTESRCAGELAPKARTREFDGNRCCHLIVCDARQGGERAVAEYRLCLPQRLDKVLRVCSEAQAHPGGGQPRRPGGFSRRPLPATLREQERCAASGFVAKLLPLRSNSGTASRGPDDKSRIAKDSPIASWLFEVGRSGEIAGAT